MVWESSVASHLCGVLRPAATNAERATVKIKYKQEAGKTHANVVKNLFILGRWPELEATFFSQKRPHISVNTSLEQKNYKEKDAKRRTLDTLGPVFHRTA